MNGKMKLIALLTMITIGYFASTSYANREGKEGKGCCSFGHKDSNYSEEREEHRGHFGHWGHKEKWGRGHGELDEKFFHKASKILKHKKELALSDKQIADIKSLKLDTEKDLITKKAEIEVVSVDIQSKLMDETIDTKALNGLIDKKYDLKKEKEKSLVASIASLKGLLTDEQRAAMKELHHHEEHDEHEEHEEKE